jgi:DNA-binding MarR family transcriptional regulator
MRIETFLQHSPMFCVSLAARRFDTLTASLLKEDDLNFLEALILSALFFESPELVKPSQLATAFSATRGNVSHYISSLEAKGLIQRRIDNRDGRAYRLALEPQGRKVAIRVIGAMDKLQRGFEDQVGKEALKSSLRIIGSLGSL